NILRGNVDIVAENMGHSLCATQASINVLMRELKIDFESAKAMVFEELDNADYKDKLIDASINCNPLLFSKGFTSGAREIMEG
ncbi:MAG: hypothetical protein HAW58_05880, partial [Candidatus Thioglobus sp.]|nr:hypothetical protein [Candidatus Thioglobus sp.]